MTTITATQQNPSKRVNSRKRGLVLWALGAIGVVSLWLLPLPADIELPLPETTVKLISLVQGLILLSVAVALGTWAAKRVGLRAPLVDALLSGDPLTPILRPQLLAAIVGSVGVAGVIFIYTLLQLQWMPADAADNPVTLPLLTRVLYGGITEEILVRWGVMSLVVWGAMRLSRQSSPSTALMLIGVTVSALLFGLLHLPAAIAFGMATPPLMILVVVGNALSAIIFGVLFWRYGLESAIAAHILAHLWIVFVVLNLLG